jgi:BirA family transcriptional regulator, biotin operon repressor / biotin---[acetyl-CoA-carboxylase] ligase
VNPSPDTRLPLDPAALQGLPPPFTLDLREALPSTSSLVAERARGGAAEGLVVVAEHQTEGRGRLDRSWVTPARAALTFSLLLRPPVPPQRWPLLALLTGVAVVEGVTLAGGPALALKWPNDVLSAEGLKVAGILLERVETPEGPAAVVGVGINVSTTRAELALDTAGSLVTAGMVDPDRTVLLRGVLESFAARYEAWRAQPADDALLEVYSERCDTLGRDVLVHLPGDRTLRGRAADLDRDGALVVEDDTGRHAVHAGDVVHVRVP